MMMTFVSMLRGGFCVATIFASSVIALPGHAADERKADPFLMTYSGSWSGEGSIRIAAGLPRMSVTCNLQNTVSGNALSMQGRCTGTLMTSNVRTSLRHNAKTGAYSGAWTAGDRHAALAGVRKGKSLSLSMDEADEPARLMMLSADGDRFDLIMKRKDTGAEVMRLALNRG
jgi:hypothetical protein